MKFLVIGEICLDVFVKCRIDRLCPEAPVPILNPVSQTDNYGMAGNVVANLKSLGGPELIVHTMTPTNTIIKTRYVDYNSGYIVMRIDENDHCDPLIIDMDHDYSQYDAIIISDYNKGLLNHGQIKWFSHAAQRHNIPIFLDTKKKLHDWSRLVTFVKINEKEYNLLDEWTTNDCQNLIVTRGSRGSEWIGHNVIVPVDPIAVADVSGAGDSYLAAFALEYCRLLKAGDDEHRVTRAMLYGNKAARIAVSKRGVVAVKAEEVL